MANGDSNADTEMPPARIKLIVVGEPEVHYLLKIDTALGKLKEMYAERIGVPVKALCFLYDGNYVHDNDTPRSLGQEDDDIVEVIKKIHLLIARPGHEDVHVRMKYGASMQKLRKAYSVHVNVPTNSLRLLFEGRHINNEDTPYSLQLQDHDVIEAFSEILYD